MLIRPVGGFILGDGRRWVISTQTLIIIVDSGWFLLLNTMHGIMITDRCDLAFFHTGGALFGEENADGCKDQLDICEDAHVVDIEQVELQFFIGVGVVLAVDLGIAGEAGLHLQAEAEVREKLIVLLSNLRALRPGADHGHVADEDVPELGEFVKADLADDAADGGDAVVLVASGEASNPVLLRIDAHAAELQDLEFPSVFGEAHLLIQSGPAVIEMDGKSGDQHKGAENNHGKAGGDDVEGTLHNGVLRGQAAAADGQDRGVKGLDMARLLHDDVAHMRQEEADDVLFLAVFRDTVSAAGVDAGDEDGLVAFQAVADGLEAVAVVLELLRNMVETFAGFSLDGAEALLVQVVAVDKDGLLRWIVAKIVGTGQIGPGSVYCQLHSKQGKKDPRVVPLVPSNRCCEPHDPGAEELGEELGKDQCANPAVAKKIGIIGAVEEKDQDAVTGNNKVVIAVAVAGVPSELAIAEEEPGDIEQKNGRQEVCQLQAEKFELLLVFTFRL